MISNIRNLIMRPFRSRSGNLIRIVCFTLTLPVSKLMDIPSEHRLNAIIRFESGDIPPLGRILYCTLSKQNDVW